MIPSTRNPKSTLAIEVEDEPQIFVEIDDEATEQVAERISRAIGSEPPPAPRAPLSIPPPAEGMRISNLALEIARAQALDEQRELEDDDHVSRPSVSMTIATWRAWAGGCSRSVRLP
jgi:hypothetical protein